MLNRRDLLVGGSMAGLTSLSFAQSVKPKRGGTLVVHAASEQRTLNPALRAAVGVYLIGSKIVEPLIDLDDKGVFVPVLATAWDAAPDGKTFTLKLREGVQWHDGKEFTSNDVKFTALACWKKNLNYATDLHRFLEDVQIPSKSVAVFKYSQPMPLGLFLRAMTDLGHVIPAHRFEGSDLLANPLNNAPIGTGPFVFTKYDRGQMFIASRNPKYWRTEGPYLDRIIWRFIPDASVAAAAMEAEEIHLSPFNNLSMSDCVRLSKDSRFIVGSKGYESSSVGCQVQMNLRQPELRDLRVRQAIAHALDAAYIVKNVHYGFAKPARSLIPRSSTEFYNPECIDYKFDPAQAKALLNAAGHPEQSDGVRFRLKMLVAPWGELPVRTGEYVKQALKSVGIDVNIEVNDGGNFLAKAYGSADYALSLDESVYRSDPAISTTGWFTSGLPSGQPWSNQSGYKNDRVDQLIKAAGIEVDAAKRSTQYKDAAKMVSAELPLVSLAERSYISVTNRVVRNSHNNARWASSSWYDTWLDT